MTDRELLERAAKAEGDVAHWEYVEDGYRDGRRIKQSYYSSLLEVTWNPLIDDGDALRLAVKLGLFSQEVVDEDITAAVFNEDPYTAIRRAIVKAAAEIHKMAEETK
jgi:hypothetical protein